VTVNVMLDLETLGTAPGSVITQIGAVEFDPQVGKLGRAFFRRISIRSAQACGLQIDGDTVKWWFSQGPKAQKQFNLPSATLPSALQDFSAWMAPLEKESVWGNGAGFDNALLTQAYRLAGQELPWKFWNDKCFRTLKNLYGIPAPAPLAGDRYAANGFSIGQHEHSDGWEPENHVAIWDAVVQAQWALAIFQKPLS